MNVDAVSYQHMDWKYSRAFANMCNAGISEKQMIAAKSKVCPEKNHFS